MEEKAKRTEEDVIEPELRIIDAHHHLWNILGDRYATQDLLRVKVNSCTECGECERKCPYNLPVIRMLKEAEGRLA